MPEKFTVPNRMYDEDTFDGAGQWGLTPQCVNCILKNEPYAATCQAFPHGIPHAIMLNRFDHRKPWPLDGDGGKVWNPINPAIPHPMDLDLNLG